MKETLGSIRAHLDKLCNQVGNRHVGSSGNRAATDYFVEVTRQLGFDSACSPFDCMEWEPGQARLQAGDKLWDVTSSPYSLPCDVAASLIEISTDEALRNAPELDGKIVLLHGQIAEEQIMPKEFVFYNPDRHKKIVATLESKRPAAIIAATGKCPGIAGSVYPFPMFEDGAFDIPSVVMKDVDGAQLTQHAGEIVQLTSTSRRIPATACNPVASCGPKDGPRILLTAHIDAKKNTPGALDNATGVAVLLAIAEHLQGFVPSLRIEFVAFNGEDYYAVPGQLLYLRQLGDLMADIELVINLDGAGCKDAGIEYSFYNSSEELEQRVQKAFSQQPEATVGSPWPQGDHSMFAMAGRPAVAVTSFNFAWLCQEITHTPKDNLDLVHAETLVRTAASLAQLVQQIAA